jgi:hypothetical protein
MKFDRVGPDAVPHAKWRGYEKSPISRLAIFRHNLP